jgi:hypothetical protein
MIDDGTEQGEDDKLHISLRRSIRCMYARIKHSVGVIETDFQVLLNSLFESSIYEAFGMLFLSLQISSAFYRQSCRGDSRRPDLLL